MATFIFNFAVTVSLICLTVIVVSFISDSK